MDNRCSDRARPAKEERRSVSMAAERKGGKAGARKRKYTMYFVPDEEMGGYTAHIPALGIVTEGESLAEARMMARDAVQGRLAVLRELNQPLPKDVQPEHLEVEV